MEWELREQLVEINKSLDEDNWHWSRQEPGSISLPDFIQLRAKGEATVINGHVCLKKPGPDPELINLLKARMAAAHEAMEKSMLEGIYGKQEELPGLAKLFKD